MEIHSEPAVATKLTHPETHLYSPRLSNVSQVEGCFCPTFSGLNILDFEKKNKCGVSRISHC